MSNGPYFPFLSFLREINNNHVSVRRDSVPVGVGTPIFYSGICTYKKKESQDIKSELRSGLTRIGASPRHKLFQSGTW